MSCLFLIAPAAKADQDPADCSRLVQPELVTACQQGKSEAINLATSLDPTDVPVPVLSEIAGRAEEEDIYVPPAVAYFLHCKGSGGGTVACMIETCAVFC